MKQEKILLDFFYKRTLQFFITCGGQKDKFLKKLIHIVIFVCERLKKAIKHKENPTPNPDSNQALLKLLPQQEREQQSELLVIYLVKCPTQSL